MLAVTFTWGDLAYLALSIFLLALGIAGAYALWRLGGTFQRLSSLIAGTEREVLPVVEKVGGTVDRVNDELDKVGVMTDSAVDAVDSADTAVRAVSWAITKPVEKVSGIVTGLSYGASTLAKQRDWRSAVQAGREAAARREEELEGELHRSASAPPAPAPEPQPEPDL
ncbi:MAG TPA: hypothetical protein VMG62_08210 [Solirubrobacteraceae bacterium]|nr:hypothetical protein [Solirubrobacteraceae bacterium]